MNEGIDEPEDEQELLYPRTIAAYLAWTDHPAITAFELGRPLSTLANIHPGNSWLH
jgi:hypothetical protein